MLAYGWRRRVLAFAAGAIGALAMPGVDWPFAMIAAGSLAVLLIDGSSGAPLASMRSAFAAGWFWGFGYFLVGLWWLGAAFLVDPGKFAWALPLGVVALPAALAIFPAVGFALARTFWSNGPRRIFAFAAALTTTEWLRGTIFTGFPWNDIGMALGGNLVTAQIAAWVGFHALTLLTLVIGAAPATLWRLDLRRADWRMTSTAALALIAIVGFGAWRISGPDAPDVANVRLRLVQPDVTQGDAFLAADGDAILKSYFALSDRATSPETSGVADVTHLIWPESAFPFLLARQPQAVRAIADFLRGGAILITGAARADAPSPGQTRPHFFNSIAVLDKSGLRPESYDKKRLVPFGEFLPFSNVLRAVGLTQFVATPGGFSAGSGDELMQIPGLPPALARICYEAIFPYDWGIYDSPPLASARWILNVTDDAWFGLTPGPYQHFAQARLRAIELGLPLVRAANTGISAVMDGRGRIRKQLGLGEQGVLDASLPTAEPMTLTRHWGAACALILLIISYGLAILAPRAG